MRKILAIAVIIFGAGFILTACVSANNNDGSKIIYETVYETTNNTVVEKVDINDLYNAYLLKNGLEDTVGNFNAFLVMLYGNFEDTTFAASEAINSIVSVTGIFTYQYRTFGNRVITEQATGSGSGIICKIDGETVYILTNAHVIYDGTSANEDGVGENIKINNAADATVVYKNLDNDIALLQTTKSNLSEDIIEAKLGTSNDLQFGQTVIAIGNPLGEGIAVTRGIVSVVTEDITMEALDPNDKDGITTTVIRTDATMNSGNSGGGLFNIRGELIGITNAKIVSDGVENMGFAIPVDDVIKIINENTILNLGAA
jgi:serine protease Do